MALNLPTAARIEELRRKQAEGELTLEEMREAIALLRSDRQAATQARTRKKAKASEEAPNEQSNGSV